MRNSKIDGKGLLPFICKHGHGYHDTTMCVECAEDRADELEKIIASLAMTIQGALRGMNSARDSHDIEAVKNSLSIVLSQARSYFDNRPTPVQEATPLGGWLRE